jgi:hypothetical protein
MTGSKNITKLFTMALLAGVALVLFTKLTTAILKLNKYHSHFIPLLICCVGHDTTNQ